MHVHNFFPLLSPAIFDACAAVGVPAVWTLHNFRVVCANGALFRDNKPCKKCVPSSPYWGAIHRRDRKSFLGSLAVAGMIGYHRFAGTWHRKVARFIALTEFSRSRFIAGGLPADKIAVKPNFVDDPRSTVIDSPRNGVVYCGRLSREKGVHTLLEAWRGLDIRLTIIGDGPDFGALRAMNVPNVSFTGRINHDDVYRLVGAAQAVVVPSICYENFPMAVVEAKAVGRPVIASRIGALAEIITDGIDGLHFRPGESIHLAHVVRGAFASAGRLAALGKAARASYEAHYTPRRNLDALMTIYREAAATTLAARRFLRARS